MNGDGRNDILVIGFPGKDASWYENPSSPSSTWKRHLVVDEVSNESPAFTDLTGDGKPEIVCIQGGRYGYALPDWKNPAAKFRFVPISPNHGLGKFTHGMGVGDVNGDGRLDVLEKGGWYEQPAETTGEPLWAHHSWRFSEADGKRFGLPGGGGAQMYAYDIDGDGDQDVITSRNAHRWGLFWYENQNTDGDGRGPFTPHIISGRPNEASPYSLDLANMHGIELVDMDGDGLKDIITGLRVWAHYGEPSAEPPGLLYWFRLSRTADGKVDWVPQLADNDSGVGVMVTVGDVDRDGAPDIVVGNKKGTYYLRHERRSVSKKEWQRSQPKRFHESGLPPERAAGEMTVPPGFEVELAAGEPLVHQPVAFTIDDRGRLWVAEGHTYPLRVNGPTGKWNEGKDNIIILEDADLDGRFETRTVFASNVNLISGIEVGFGGVWVGAAPYLLFFPDADGDDVPDGAPEILLDGFGLQDTHETLNSFSWGPDGWLYGCHGVFTHSLVGTPGTPDDERVPMNGAYWRFHPQRRTFEVFAWGTSNPWGLDFDDYGQAFASACVIPHLYHVIQGARYQRQGGQHFNRHIYEDIRTIADHLHFVGSVQDHAWWGQEPRTKPEILAAGGGHAHCGLMVYLGDSFPPEHRNRLYMNNIHGNRINEDVPERQGSGYVGRHGKDLVITNDAWYRGIGLRYGPDGDVYFTDWYDKHACHRTNPVIWDRGNGRVYRLSYVGERAAPKRTRVQLSKLSSAELVKLQLHANDWYVRVARRLLQERGPDEQVHAALRKILDEHPETSRKLRALWALHVTKGLENNDYARLLESDSEHLRGWAIQLRLETGDLGTPFSTGEYPFVASMRRLAKSDPSPWVRRYIASGLQRLPIAQRLPVIEELLAHAEDQADHNLPLLYWYGLEPVVAASPAESLRLAQASRIPKITRFIVRRTAADSKNVDIAVQILNRASSEPVRLALLEELHTALKGQADVAMPPAWNVAFPRLIESEDARVRDLAETIAVLFGDRRIFPHQRAILADPNAPLERRRHALSVVVKGADKESVSILQRLLSNAALRGDALLGLAKLDHPDNATAILDAYGKLTPAERSVALNTLAARPRSAAKLLDAVGEGRVPRKDIGAVVARQIDAFDDEALTARLTEVWGAVRKTAGDKLARIEALKNQLSGSASADAAAGRTVYRRTCQQCHALFGVGSKIAPDLTGSNRANLDYILENLVDPNAVVGRDYQNNVFLMRDSRLVSGLVQSESDSAITVQTVDSVVVLPKKEIVTRSLSDESLMPEGLIDTLTEEALRDLIAYLASPTQVREAGTKVSIDPETGKVPGAIEAEDLTSRATDGQLGPQDMGGFGKAKWSGNRQLWWRHGPPGSRLKLRVPVKAPGSYRLELAMTKAVDYGVFKTYLNGESIDAALDLYDPRVIPTGNLFIAEVALEAGEQLLEFEVLGANPKAAKSYMLGIDYILLLPIEDGG